MISKGDKVSFNPALIEMEYQGKPHTDLSEDLMSWRADRPDEWTTDRFIRKATQLEGLVTGYLTDLCNAYEEINKLKECKGNETNSQ